jgi:hypothetical protein
LGYCFRAKLRKTKNTNAHDETNVAALGVHANDVVLLEVLAHIVQRLDLERDGVRAAVAV